MSHGLRTAARRVASVLLAVALACGLSACKPTDFFTEVIISPFAETVDEDNDLHTVINSPDAEEESDELSALDWTDESEQSEETENLVVYSSEPTSSLTTRHTIFDLYPMLSDVEASDGVRVLYDADADLDEENDGDDDEDEDDAESQSTGGEASEEALEELLSELAGTGTTTGEATEGEGSASGEGDESGDESGTQADGDEASNTSGEDDGEGDDGSADDANGGYGGEVDVYDAGNAFAEVPQADSVAVLGTDVAVLVQAIGGEGSICAMSADAYYGSDDDTTASCFQVVFGELAGEIDTDDFEANKLLWENDGSDPEDLVDVDALVEACGEGGVIYYDQDLGDQSSFFDASQRIALQEAGITLVPVDLSSVQGLLDAAAAIGDTLDGSATCANDSQEYASMYTKAVRSIVKGVAATHGGTIAATSKSGAYNLLTDYNNCPVGSASVVGGQGFPIKAYIATDAATGWTFSGSVSIDTTSILLFQNDDYDSSPLAFWGQVAGVAPGASSVSSTSEAELLWPYTRVTPVNALTGSGSTYNRWLSSDSSYDIMQAGPTSTSEGLLTPESYGLGSKYIPYLIVCATDELTADEVRSLTVDSLGSYGTSGEVTSYSAFPFYSASSGEGTGVVPTSSSGLRSTIGSQNADAAYSESPFYTNLSTDSVVRANPIGLLGSWTEGTMESVLESVWLADLYSRSPDGCAYTAINDMADFSATIGELECTTTEEAATAFYQTFYRLSESAAQTCYDAAVTDQLEDLS